MGTLMESSVVVMVVVALGGIGSFMALTGS
jgi:hypothetical protein